jgi:hypothetical protein
METVRRAALAMAELPQELRKEIWREEIAAAEFWATFPGESTVHQQMSTIPRSDRSDGAVRDNADKP